MNALPSDHPSVQQVIGLDIDFNEFLDKLTIAELEELKFKHVKYSSLRYNDTLIRVYCEMLPLAQQLKDF